MEGFDLAVNGAGSDAEKLGGEFFVAIGATESFADNVAFDLVEGGSKGDNKVIAIGVGLMDFGREIGGFDVGAGSEDDSAFDHIFELSDVAGPSVLFEDLDGFFFEVQEGLSVFLGVFVEKVLSKQRDIVGAFAQRGDMDLDHVESVVEVFTETALFDFLAEVFVGCGDQADIDRSGECAAEPLYASVLEDAQQLDLYARNDLADLIEEKGSAVGQLKSTGLCVVCARERAFFVAEEFAIKEGFRKGRTVEGNKLLMASVAEAMEFAGDQFFSCAGLALDQNGCVGGSGLFDDIHRASEGRALADDQGGFFDILEALSEMLVFLKQRGAVKGFFDEFEDIAAFEWLGDKVVCALFDGLDCAFDAAVGGHGDDFGVCGDGFDRFEQR